MFTKQSKTNLPKLMREHADYMETVTDFIGSPDAIARALRDGADEIESLQRKVNHENLPNS